MRRARPRDEPTGARGPPRASTYAAFRPPGRASRRCGRSPLGSKEDSTTPLEGGRPPWTRRWSARSTRETKRRDRGPVRHATTRTCRSPTRRPGLRGLAAGAGGVAHRRLSRQADPPEGRRALPRSAAGAAARRPPPWSWASARIVTGSRPCDDRAAQRTTGPRTRVAAGRRRPPGRPRCRPRRGSGSARTSSSPGCSTIATRPAPWPRWMCRSRPRSSRRRSGWSRPRAPPPGALPMVARHSGLDGDRRRRSKPRSAVRGFFSFEPGEGAVRRLAQGDRPLAVAPRHENDEELRDVVSSFVGDALDLGTDGGGAPRRGRTRRVSLLEGSPRLAGSSTPLRSASASTIRRWRAGGGVSASAGARTSTRPSTSNPESRRRLIMSPWVRGNSTAPSAFGQSNRCMADDLAGAARSRADPRRARSASRGRSGRGTRARRRVGGSSPPRGSTDRDRTRSRRRTPRSARSKLASRSGARSASPWISGNRIPNSSWNLRAVASCLAGIVQPDRRGRRDARATTTVARPQPSSTTSSPADLGEEPELGLRDAPDPPCDLLGGPRGPASFDPRCRRPRPRRHGSRARGRRCPRLRPHAGGGGSSPRRRKAER